VQCENIRFVPYSRHLGKEMSRPTLDANVCDATEKRRDHDIDDTCQ